MEEITLQALLEAGCHFGHKAERWHPKAGKFIYTKKDGIHIIDLAKTKAGLEAAMAFVRDTAATGKEVVFVGTKRQASGVVKQEVSAVGAPYFVERWIGGFMTNWEQIKKNIQKINNMDADRATGAWKKFPKHEQVKMARYLDRIKVYYSGVLAIKDVPAALVIVDIKKEEPAVREGRRCNIPVVGIVDTNSDPTDIDYVVPANDDAVGSIQYIIHALAQSYAEGKAMAQKEAEVRAAEVAKAAEAKKVADDKASEARLIEVQKAEAAKAKAAEEVIKKAKVKKSA